MPKPVIRGNKVQAWRDKHGIEHAVAFKSEPHRLLCRAASMWSYSPRLALIEDINCPECRIEMESGV